MKIVNVGVGDRPTFSKTRYKLGFYLLLAQIIMLKNLAPVLFLVEKVVTTIPKQLYKFYYIITYTLP